jgi:hypothetical protein
MPATIMKTPKISDASTNKADPVTYGGFEGGQAFDIHLSRSITAETLQQLFCI